MNSSIKILQNCFIVSAVTILISCGSSNDISEHFPINKKYWDAKDYADVINRIKYATNGVKKPSYSDPQKAIVFTKLVDKTNASVVFEDASLGISHRSEYGEEMFHHYQTLEEIYEEVDREDKFVYPLELVDISKLGLYIQLHYFGLGNENIKKRSDNPNSAEVVQLVNSNNQILVNNYSNYYNYVKNEEGLSNDALKSYISGLNEYFPALIDKYPAANYDEMKTKTMDMINKAKSADLKAALNNILTKINSLKKEEPVVEEPKSSE